MRTVQRHVRSASRRVAKLIRAALVAVSCTLAMAGATVSAQAQAPTLSMNFGSSTISVGSTTAVSFTLNNNGPRADNVAFGYSLPAGLVIANPPRVMSACGGSVSANPGGRVFQISGVAMRPRTSCTLSINITATSVGAKNGATTAVASNIGMGRGASASILVVPVGSSGMTISPTSGTILGGTRVTISGMNLAGATEVRIGGTPISNFTVVDRNTITAVTPANTAGTVDVVVTTPSGTDTGSALYTYVTPFPAAIIGGVVAAGVAVGAATLGGGGSDPVPLYPTATAAPTLNSISPASGPTVGGTPVVIKGTNLTATTLVRVGGVQVSNFSVVNSTTINAITGARPPGTADVAVSTPVGNATAPSLYTYMVPLPSVTSVGPSSGSTLGGMSVTITGAHLTGATSVTIGGLSVAFHRRQRHDHYGSHPRAFGRLSRCGRHDGRRHRNRLRPLHVRDPAACGDVLRSVHWHHAGR